MQNQPEKQLSKNAPVKPPPNSRPEGGASRLGPVEQRSTAQSWLPYAFWGGIGLALLFAVGFVVYAFFFYKPDVPPAQPVVVLPTPEPVQFQDAPADSSQSQAPANNAEPAAAQSEQSAPANDAQTEAGQSDQSDTENGQTTQPDSGSSDATSGTVSQPPVNSGPVTMASPDYGIHAFLYWRPEVADRDLQLITEAGFTWVKQEFAWREIEGGEKGGFNWDNTDRMMGQIEQHHLKVLARVGVQPAWAGGGYPEIGPPDNYQDFGDFLFALASRYKGRIQAYQIWNEPNLSREWGNRPPNPTEYTALLKVAYEAVKRADPNALVISAGLAPTTRNDDVAMPDTFFVQGMYDAGAKPYFDLLGAHGAGYKAPPDMDPADIARDPNFANPGDFAAGVPEELRRIYGFRHVEDLRAIMVRNNDADKKVAILEFGWTMDPRPDSPYRWHAVSEELQGDYIVGAYQYAKEHWQPWIGVMVVIYMPNSEWTDQDEQTYWSIVVPRWPDTWMRPAYLKFKAMPK